MNLSIEDKTPGDHAESCERYWGVNWLADIDTRYHPEHMSKHVERELASRSDSLSRAVGREAPRRRTLGLGIASSLRRMKRAA